MKAFERDQVKIVVDRAKQCILGKIEEEFRKRVPPKPAPLNRWEKYLLIKQGVAVLKDLQMQEVRDAYSGDLFIFKCYTYPVRPEDVEYEAACKAVEQEKLDREMNVETSFNRVADERIMGLIDAATFLDTVEKMQAEIW